MRRGHVLGLSALLVFGAAGAAWAVAEVKSGLQVGDAAPPFHVQDITGPHAGQKLCYR